MDQKQRAYGEYLLQSSTNESFEMRVVTALVPSMCGHYIAYHTQKLLQQENVRL